MMKILLNIYYLFFHISIFPLFSEKSSFEMILTLELLFISIKKKLIILSRFSNG